MTVEVPGCRILIRPLKVEEHDKVVAAAMAAGIKLLEEDSRKRQTTVDKGYVLKMGSRCSLDYVEGVQIGDLIGFAKFGGKFIKDVDEDLLIINDEDCVCIFRDE